MFSGAGFLLGLLGSSARSKALQKAYEEATVVFENAKKLEAEENNY